MPGFRLRPCISLKRTKLPSKRLLQLQLWLHLGLGNNGWGSWGLGKDSHYSLSTEDAICCKGKGRGGGGGHNAARLTQAHTSPQVPPTDLIWTCYCILTSARSTIHRAVHSTNYGATCYAVIQINALAVTLDFFLAGRFGSVEGGALPAALRRWEI